jgi:hypothetical protein
MLFAWMSRAVVERAGESKGERIVRLGVRRYGEERGRRMALRARKEGYGLTVATYRAFGEWRAGEGEVELTAIPGLSSTRMVFSKCPWHQAWERNGLIPFGRYYCLEIDKALVRGFNPLMNLEVTCTQTNDGKPCDFLFKEASPAPGAGSAAHSEEPITPQARTVMPWVYHLGHLYKTMREVLVEEMGQTGYKAAEAALRVFDTHYGRELSQAVASCLEMDFDRPPE